MLAHPNYPNGNVYLSGGMNAINQLGKEWRERESKVLKSLGYFPIDITALDNAYTEAYADVLRFTNDQDVTGLTVKSNIRKHFIEADINLLQLDTDAILLYYDEHVRTGAGSLSECYEGYRLGMPVFVVNAYPELKDVPGWLQAETTRMFSSFAEFYEYLVTLPNGILKRDKYGNRYASGKYLCSLCGEVEEKHGDHYVSKVSPTYCKQCVGVVRHTNEEVPNRYDFFREFLANEMNKL